MFKLDNCRFVVWGYKSRYTTHSHIHAAFERALDYLGREVHWMDADPPNDPNIFFLTNHDVAGQLPLRDDCFYLVHGLNDYAPLRERFAEVPHCSWNVYHAASHSHAPGGAGPIPGALDPATQWLAPDTPFWPAERRLDFRWATDLVPPEIEALKPERILGRDSRVVNWVGTRWFVNEHELSEFSRACRNGGVEFRHLGAQRGGAVSIEENIRLVRESCMAPAISGSHHITEGYMPCRLPKNISYGQPGITNSPRMQDLFEGLLIFDPDPYRLFATARERLASYTVKELHHLMDLVATRHTYVQRLDAIFEAVRLCL